jgi:pilus assembly protein Flp/PilA
MANDLQAALYSRLRTWLRDEDAQGLVEYALILVLIALVAIVALQIMGGDVQNELSTVASSIPA